MTTPRPTSLRAAWLPLTGLAAVFLVEMLDTSLLNVALPTIGRDLGASTLGLQWVTGAYAVVYGGLMLLFGALSDRYGRRRVMLVGLVLLGSASAATAAVGSTGALIAVRVAMGVAAAMTTPGSLALAFRLFDDDRARVSATTAISTVGLVGLAVGPPLGGLLLAVVPWQVLLLVNVPVAALAWLAIRLGIPADRPDELHRDPVDVLGAALGTAAVVLALVTPTLLVDLGVRAWQPWAAGAAAALALVGFVARERSTAFPLLDLALVARPLVSAGMAYKAASGLAVAGMGYLVTLQLQLGWGWSPAKAAVGMLPQVAVLLAGGLVIRPVVDRLGLVRAAWLSSTAIVAGLGVFAAAGRFGYLWVALALVLVAAGMRVVGVVAGLNVMRGLPENRTTIGAALADTATEVPSGVGIALSGTVLAAMVTGSVTATPWTVQQADEFRSAVTVAATALTVLAAALVGWAARRARGARPAPLVGAATGM